MVYLAKVLCLILVATATSVSSKPLSNSIKKSLDAALVSAQSYVNLNFDMLIQISEDSMSMVDSRLRELRAQENEDVTAEVFQCYENYKASHEDEHHDLLIAWQGVTQRFEDRTLEAKNLASLYEKNLLNNSDALEYIKKIWRESIDIVEQATSTLHELYDKGERKYVACNDLLHLPNTSNQPMDVSSITGSL